MKRQRTLFYVLMFLPLALTLVALVVLPDRVPMHYDAAGNIDRWGGKYENLVFPVVTAGMGAFFLAIGRFSAKRDGGRNERVLLLLGSATLALFNVMTVVFLVQAYLAAAGEGGGPLELARILYTVTGVVFIVVGNVLPKLRRNSAAGVRTAWSRESDENWRVSQMAGGVAFLAGGLVLIVGNVFLVRERGSNAFSLTCLILTALALVAALEVIKRRKGRS